MLSDLKTFGISEGYFNIMRIGDFDNAQREGFAHVNTHAIDFDKTKLKLCDDLKQECCASCDVLDIIEAKNRINFIEFKELKDNAAIEAWIEGLDLPQKIKDSRDVLFNIVRDKRLVHGGKKSKFLSCDKNIIISFNLSATGRNRLATVFRWLTVKAIIERQFYQNHIIGEKFSNPICIRMHEFDLKYAAYV